MSFNSFFILKFQFRTFHFIKPLLKKEKAGVIYEKISAGQSSSQKKAELFLFDQTGKDEHMKKREYAGRILLAAIAGVFFDSCCF